MNKKWILVVLVVYSLAIGLSYALPLSLNDVEWHGFYSYLDKEGAIPYVDVREGYPPLGFIVYTPLYWLFPNNSSAFAVGYKALNAAFLVATVYVLYLIVRSLFNEKKGLQYAVYFAVLPSVVIANVYSNDIIALLPAALAIYMMVKKRPFFCGLLIGIATLGKGFPLLLLIPALFYLNGVKNKLKVIASTLGVLVLVSLPFLLLNPLTYASTFTNVSSRGPWETVWAFADGYFSHGGFLHPLFDKFFYHSNLLMMYPSSHFDHAIYSWNIDFLPNLLTFLQIGSILLLSLLLIKRRNKFLLLSGLLYVSYMLFFKGYSTQFAVSTPFFVILASIGNPLIFLIPLEFSHVMQIISWSVPDALRDWHFPLLVSSVVLRTVVFSVLILYGFRGYKLDLSSILKLFRHILRFFNVFKSKKVVFLLILTITVSLVALSNVQAYSKNESSFKTYKYNVNYSYSEWNTINLEGLEQGDQVMVKINTSTWLDAKAVSGNSIIQMERGIVNPYNLKGSFNYTMLFFRSQSNSYDLMFKMLHPAIPFRVTDGLDRGVEVSANATGNSLEFNVSDEQDGRDGSFRLAYPVDVFVDDDFKINFKYQVENGNVSETRLSVFEDQDEWIYTFDAHEDFVLLPDSEDVMGYGNLRGGTLSLVILEFSLKDGSSAQILINELEIINQEKSTQIPFYSYDSEAFPIEIFVEHDFSPSLLYQTSLILAVIFGGLTLFFCYIDFNKYYLP